MSFEEIYSKLPEDNEDVEEWEDEEGQRRGWEDEDDDWEEDENEKEAEEEL